MSKGLRLLGLGVSLGATFSVAFGAARRLSGPRIAAPLALGPGPSLPAARGSDGNVPAAPQALAEADQPAPVVTRAEPAGGSGVRDHAERRRSGDRRRGGERRQAHLVGLVGRILRATERRQGADRRSGSDRRASAVAEPQRERNAA